MGLSIAVFVPEGIVIGCDTQAEVNNSDDGFVQANQSRLFTFADRFLINIIGSGFSNGLPYAYYVEKVLCTLKERVFDTTREFAVSFDEKFTSMIGKDEHAVYYIAGIDSSKETVFEPVVYLVEDKNVNAINRGINRNVVYNYHAIGNTMWLDKLILPTSSRVNDDEEIVLDEARIDFSKYSMSNAVEFVKTMLSISNSMDKFAQLKPRVGSDIAIGILTLSSKIKFI